MAWGIIGGSAIGFLGSYQTNKQSMDMAKHGYSYAMQDMKAAGLNPILAGQYGPISIPSLQNPGAVAVNSANALTSAQKNTVQTQIQEHIEEIATDLHEAWKNSGQQFTQWVSNASWESIGATIGNAIGQSTQEIIATLKSMFNAPGDAIKSLFKPNATEHTPENASGQFRDLQGNFVDQNQQ
jgi:hypothetical protein